MAEIWTIALDLASSRLAVEREGLEKARAELEADKAEATELADRLAAQVDDLQAAEAAARAQLDQVRSELAKVQAKAQADQAERDQAREMAARLQGELDATKAQNAALLAVFKPV